MSNEIEGDDLDLGSHPHDAFFKQTFSDLVRARALFQSHLPAEVSDIVQLETLELVPASFVKKDLHQAHGDLLFTVQTTDDRSLMLYLLVEHQTTVDPSMPLRLMDYQNSILRKLEKENGLPPPPVVSLVLNQGPRKWSVSPQFQDAYQLGKQELSTLSRYLPKFEYHVIDLTQIDPDQTENDPQVRAVLQLMKLARAMKVAEFFRWLSQACDSWIAEIPDPLIRSLVIYAMHSDSRLDVKEVTLNLTNRKNIKKTMSSLAERLIAQGKAEGKAEGTIQGEARGEIYGKIQSFEEFLGEELSSKEDLVKLGLDELKSQLADLRTRYERKFKGA